MVLAHLFYNLQVITLQELHLIHNEILHVQSDWFVLWCRYVCPIVGVCRLSLLHYDIF